MSNVNGPVLLVILLTTGIAGALISGNIAGRKGYSTTGFMLFGLLLPLIAIIVAIVMPDKNSTSTVSTADELAKFKKLLDDGAITQDEYESKKSELLGRNVTANTDNSKAYYPIVIAIVAIIVLLLFVFLFVPIKYLPFFGK